MSYHDFVEIGTSDFKTLIENSSDETIGISVEPIKFYLDKLPNKKKCKKINIGISDKSSNIDIYYVSEENIKKYNLPWWARGCNSVNKMHKGLVKILNDKNLDPTKLFSNMTIPTCTLYNLLEENNVNGIYYLKIDTEGHDTIILNKYLKDIKYNHMLPYKLKFESNGLTNILDIYDTINSLKKIGYKQIMTDHDTIMELDFSLLKKDNYFFKIENYYLENNENSSIYCDTIEDAKKECKLNNYIGINVENNNIQVIKNCKLKKADNNKNIYVLLYL